jgi:aspartate aminotransferase
MTLSLSSRLDRIKTSSTMAVNAKVLELRAAGRQVIGFAAGEPDFPTWTHICDAARAAIDRGDFQYTAVGGTPALKQAIVTKLGRDNGLDYDLCEVMANCGGKHSLFNIFQALVEEGDEVVIPAPYWVSYPDMVALAGGTPRIVHAAEERGFLLSAAELEAAITPATKAVVINSPSNPTGAAYDEAALRALAEVLERSQCWVIVDDVYEMIRYDGARPAHLCAIAPSLKARTIISNSVSKTYAMTGWRLGYTAGPAQAIAAMTTLQGQSTSNPSTIAQAAAVAALTGAQDQLGPMVAEFHCRRDYVCDRINAMDGLSVAIPPGAFYVFVNARGVFERAGVDDGDSLALAMLEGAGIGAVGGNDFGSADHIRLSYATSMETIERGMDALETWLGRL